MTALPDFFIDEDPELEIVAAHVQALDPNGARWGAVIRHTYDMLYNGQETGRYKWDQLFKTEKTHFGTLLEINAQREFGFYDGDVMDYSVGGVEVDAKWSQTDGGWMLPPESFGHLILVATGNDAHAQWSLGIVRVSEVNRRSSANRDGKTSLNQTGRQAIRWLWRRAELPPNVLLQLSESALSHIFDGHSGQERILRLLRAAEGRVIHRSTIATVGRQLDPMKRLRGNGGARTHLASEGYLVLTGNYYADLAKKFGAPVPSRGEVVAIRVVPAQSGGIEISGRSWRRAEINEDVRTAAPLLPERGSNTS